MFKKHQLNCLVSFYVLCSIANFCIIFQLHNKNKNLNIQTSTEIELLKKKQQKNLEEFVQKITTQLQEQASALAQNHEKQMETLKVDVSKSQEEIKSLKLERDTIQSEIEKIRDDHNKTITFLEEQFLRERESFVRKHEKDLSETIEALTLVFKDQKLSLDKEIQIQINEKSKKIQDSLEETSNLKDELARRSDKTEEMKHTFETERLQFQNDSEKLKDEIEKLKVEIVAQNNQTEQLKQEFENERNIFSDEIKKFSLGATENQISIRTLEEKLSSSKDENNSSNERISKLTDDLEAANQQLEPFLTQEKINQKIVDDQNALALAVEEGNQEKVSFILKNSGIGINSEIKFEAKKIEGPILTLAIQNEDFEMIKMLVQDFGADVNQKITWSQNQSNILILAMAKGYER
jgi:DNA repair exonuclease SbcCD ATPase subunit